MHPRMFIVVLMPKLATPSEEASIERAIHSCMGLARDKRETNNNDNNTRLRSITLSEDELERGKQRIRLQWNDP